MREMQFTALVMMTVYALILILLLPRRVKRDRVANRSRWLMAGGLGLLAMQFLVQYIFGFRLMGVTQAVMVNLAFFIPVTALISLSVLNLQRQGRLSTLEKWIAIPLWLAAMAVMLAAVMQGPPYNSHWMLWSEVGASLVYGVLQLYYSWLHIKELKRMETVLDDYYDRDEEGLLQWMRWSTVLLAVLVLFVPVFIFTSGILLIVYALVFIFGFSAMWFCFSRYLMSGDASRVQEAEGSEENRVKGAVSAAAQLTSEEKAYVNQIVERWLSHDGHLRKGLTKPMVVSETGLSDEQLTGWYHANGHDSFKQWINALRVEKAKVLLKENPTWSNESVADQCGISRSRFHSIFKDAVGLSPTEYQAQQ